MIELVIMLFIIFALKTFRNTRYLVCISVWCQTTNHSNSSNTKKLCVHYTFVLLHTLKKKYVRISHMLTVTTKNREHINTVSANCC